MDEWGPIRISGRRVFDEKEDVNSTRRTITPLLNSAGHGGFVQAMKISDSKTIAELRDSDVERVQEG